MSAISGIRIRERMARQAATSSFLGTVTRTISQPASASRGICATVSATSKVFVVVIDWTQIGFSPPTTQPPTPTSRVLCRATVVLYAMTACPRLLGGQDFTQLILDSSVGMHRNRGGREGSMKLPHAE